MTPLLASIVFAVGISGLFLLDRSRKERASAALWIPCTWLFLAASRVVSEWLPSAASATGSDDPYMEGNALDRNVLAGLLALGIVVLIRRRRRVGILLRENIPILLYFSYCGLSIFWSEFHDVSFKRWIRSLGDLTMVLLVLSEANPLAAFKRLFARVGFLLVPLSILLIRYYPDMGRRYSRWDGGLVWTGVTTDKNTLGMICLIFALASAWRFLQVWLKSSDSSQRGSLIAHGTVFLLAVWLIWGANSATSLACLILAGGVMLLAHQPRLARKPGLIHLSVATAVLVSVAALFLDIGSGLVQGLGRDSTLTGRTEIWRIVLGMGSNRVFGTGYESFWLGPRLEQMWNLYYNHVNQAHNGYLEIFLNLGWVGLALLAAVLVAGYRRSVAAVVRQTQTGSLRLAYFIVAVVYNFTEGGFKMMHPVWICFLLAVAATPETQIQEQPKASADDSNVPVAVASELFEDAACVEKLPPPLGSGPREQGDSLIHRYGHR